MSNVKSKSPKEEERLDSGMEEGLGAFFTHTTPRQTEPEPSASVSSDEVQRLVQEQVGQVKDALVEQVKEQLQQLQSAIPTKAQPGKKPPKKTVLSTKAGLYLSDVVLEWLDREWKKQPRKQQKSKSLIVEQILRQHWGLPSLEE